MRKILIPLLIIAVLGFARTDGTVPSIPGYRTFQILRHNINQVEMSISNYGKFGQSGASVAGCWWPRGSGQNYIFGAGPWFGTIDEATGDTLVTIGYGPHGGEAEYGPGLAGWSVSDPNAVIFMYPSNFPPPADKYPMAPQAYRSHQDSWCAYNDLDATYHMAGDTRPIGLEVYQTVYAWNLSTTQDIIFIRYELKNVSGNKLTRCYFGVCTDNDIGNESGSAANDIISGIVYQVYKFPGSSDSIIVDNLGYQWQEADEGGWTPPVPGAMGFDYLQSPYKLVENADADNDGIPDQYERDSAYYASNVPPEQWDGNGNGVPGWRDPAEIPQYGMTAFKRFTLNLEPNKDNERFVTMCGFNFKTGAYEPFDTVPPPPDDQRFLQVSGPFELEADSITTVLVGVIFARWDGLYTTPDSALVQIDATCQFIYNMNWLLPGPPPPPILVCVPGDKKVTLIWSNLSENTLDPYYNVVHYADSTSPVWDPYYLPYDFEGYRIWRSQTGQTSDWLLLASYDKANGITFIDSIGFADSIALEATDNGLVHSYIDEDVRNGFSYYYAISAFDYNFVKGVFDSLYIDTFYVNYDTLGNPDTIWDYDTARVIGKSPLWFESGKVGITVVPRREAANYVMPGTPVVTALTGNPLLDTLVRGVVTYPLDVDANKSLIVEMGTPLYDTIYETDTLGVTKWYTTPIYTIWLKDEAGTPIDSIRGLVRIGTGYRPTEFIASNGISVICDVGTPVFPTAINLFDSVTVVSGTYPSAYIDAVVMSPIPNHTNAYSYDFGFWAYRGHDYTVTWHAAGTGGSTRTVTVVDALTGETIPYGAFRNNDTTATIGACWTFTRAGTMGGKFQFISDTLEFRAASAGARTKTLYIMGGAIYLKNGLGIVDSILPADGDVWTVKSNDAYLPPSVLGSVEVTGTPGYFDNQEVTLNVKVVPNPYIVHNEWQQSSLIRRLRFINLPNQCTVRIFNLNGELVRTILHTETIATTTGTPVENSAGGDEWWDLLSENRQLVSSGVYIFHVESAVGDQIGKFAVVR